MFRGIPADATFRGVVYNPSELPKMIRGITRKKFASIFQYIYLICIIVPWVIQVMTNS
jgi:hypothetical protein